jgi:2-amino-4-hydroxy-6-hydroxymethyldihydropteridine diphosphokinase
MKHEIYLGLGTNIGDRLANLKAAVDALPPEVEAAAVSPIYQTPPWGYEDQEDFLNQVVMAETNLEPLALLEYIKEIEEQVGRRVTFRWGPREIDIDILFYDDLVMENETLTIPHPRVHERAFMLVPLADIAPELMHPLAGQTINKLLNKLDKSDIELFEE